MWGKRNEGDGMKRCSLSMFCLCLACVVVGCGEEVEPTAQPSMEATDDAVPATKAEAAERKQSGKADLPFDLCERNGWYEDDECDWFCSDHDPVCHAEPLGPEPQGEPARYPIILAHGFNAGLEGNWSFYKVEAALVADGHTVHSAEVPAFASAATRAEYLAEQVDELLDRTGGGKVNIIAHSMGGLDSRYLISALGYGDRVASLTTISSPHGGSAVADVALALVPGESPADVIDGLATVWSRTFNEVETDADVRAALTSLSTAEMEDFNAKHLDDGRVYYQSWAGVSSVFGIDNPKDIEACEGKFLWHEGQSDVMNAQLVPMAAVLAPGVSFTPNDGMATVEAAKWGEFQGCIPADHFDEVGQIRHDSADPHTGFDHLRFYRNLAYGLTERGF